MIEVKDLIEKLKPAAGIKLAKGMNNSLDEKNSLWRYKMQVSNSLPESWYLILLPGAVEHNRIAKVTSDGETKYYQGIEGDPVVLNTNGCTSFDQDYVLVKDFAKEHFDVFSFGKYIIPSNKRFCLYPQTEQIRKGTETLTFQSGNESDFTIDKFRLFLKSNALKLVQTQIVSTNIEQFGKSILWGYKEPFQKFQPITLELTDFYKPQNNQKKVEINKEMIFDSTAFYAIEIPANTTTDITWVFSHNYSLHGYLEEKTQYENLLKSLKQ